MNNISCLVRPKTMVKRHMFYLQSWSNYLCFSGMVPRCLLRAISGRPGCDFPHGCTGQVVHQHAAQVTVVWPLP